MLLTDFAIFTRKLAEKMQLLLSVLSSFSTSVLSLAILLMFQGGLTRVRRLFDHVTLILENLTGASRLASGCTIEPRECMSFIGNEFTLWLACLSEMHPRNCNINRQDCNKYNSNRKGGLNLERNLAYNFVRYRIAFLARYRAELKISIYRGKA